MVLLFSTRHATRVPSTTPTLSSLTDSAEHVRKRLHTRIQSHLRPNPPWALSPDGETHSYGSQAFDAWPEIWIEKHTGFMQHSREAEHGMKYETRECARVFSLLYIYVNLSGRGCR